MAQASVPTALPLSATDLLAQDLPDLNISPDPCQCHAPHDVKYVASLKPWPNFKIDVISDFQCQPWSQTTLGCYIPDSPTDEFSRGIEYVKVGTSRGVRGRFNERVGQYVGPVFKLQQIDLVFDGFGCQTYVISDERAPSLIIINEKFETRVLGEVRVPWIDQHDVELMVGDMDSGNDARLRRGIGRSMPCSLR
jgi:hypothetical protein